MQTSSEANTALILAAENGHERVVDMLLQHGAEVNQQSSDGGTALMLTAVFNRPAVVRRLLWLAVGMPGILTRAEATTNQRPGHRLLSKRNQAHPFRSSVYERLASLCRHRWSPGGAHLKIGEVENKEDCDSCHGGHTCGCAHGGAGDGGRA